MSDPYATHIPVLRAVLGSHKPKRVLELGTGPHSTRLFLDAGVELVSLETDEAWCGRARRLGADVRLVENVADNLPPLTDFDLVFVDDSHDKVERERTIRAVLGQPHPLTVIHDADVPEYRQAMVELSDPLFFKALTPHTAICPERKAET